MEAGAYIIAPSTFYPNQETVFFLRVYSNSDKPFQLVEATNAPSVLVRIHLSISLLLPSVSLANLILIYTRGT